ncbi:MAG: hypothetical protein JWM40_3080, partial [Frankiales bacterium]|nr:hypothetical protein [Frankiales bacterium]
TTLTSGIAFHYAGTDHGAGLFGYDVRYRRAAFNGPFGAYAYPSGWQGTAATTEVGGATAGYTYCFSARAHDAVTNVSAWTADTCTVTPLDDRALAASTGWTRGPSSAYFASTVTSTKAKGRTLTRSSVQTRRISLLATTCKGCGEIGVYWNNVLVRTLNLNASTTTYKHLLVVTDFGTVRSGTLMLKTLNTGRSYVDGIALSRV